MKAEAADGDENRPCLRILDRVTVLVAVGGLSLLLVERSLSAWPPPAGFVVAHCCMLLYFLADSLYRKFSSPVPFRRLKHRWLEGTIPLAFLLLAARLESLYIAAAVAAILVMLVTRARNVMRNQSDIELRPASWMVLGFMIALIAGGLLLTTPAATVEGERTVLLDALFTSTSAVCVTGLIVRDTATYFSRFGQLVILVLIQLGGLGIMTFGILLVLLMHKRMDMHQRIVMREVFDRDELAGLIRLVRFIFLMTLLVEGLGALMLSLAWFDHFASPLLTLYHAVFHAVSAFCNAGFSTFSDSLTGFAGHALTNLVIILLIVCGGFGFVVMKDIYDNIRGAMVSRHVMHVKVQTRVVLSVSIFLIVVGAFFFVLLEAPSGQEAGPVALWVAFFQSVSTRTAGFNSCDIGALEQSTLFVMILLMFIGASPGSTGGGIKTTTFAVLWTAMLQGLLNRPHVEMFRRTLTPCTIRKAVTVFTFSLLILIVFTTALLVTEDAPLMTVLFETVSAVATVGLSMGLTPELTATGRILIIALMFIGRLGPLTVAYLLILPRRRFAYKYAEERVMIG